MWGNLYCPPFIWKKKTLLPFRPPSLFFAAPSWHRQTSVSEGQMGSRHQGSSVRFTPSTRCPVKRADLLLRPACGPNRTTIASLMHGVSENRTDGKQGRSSTQRPWSWLSFCAFASTMTALGAWVGAPCSSTARRQPVDSSSTARLARDGGLNWYEKQKEEEKGDFHDDS